MCAMSTRRLSRAETKERTRREVLDAAGVVFARRGFEAATVQEIADEAGRTTGAIYTHFATKADLFLALLDQDQQRRLATFEEFAATPGDAVERFAAWFGQDPDRWDMLRFEFWRYAAHNPELAAERSRHLRAEHVGMARVFEVIYANEGVAAPQPPLELAMLVVALAEGLRMLRRTEPTAPVRELFTYALRRITSPTAQP
jgi:AcrR family transcriptional regulator